MQGVSDSGNKAEMMQLDEGLVNEAGGSYMVSPSPIPPANTDPDTICSMLHQIMCTQHQMLQNQTALYKAIRGLAYLQKVKDEKIELTSCAVNKLQVSLNELQNMVSIHPYHSLISSENYCL